MSRPAYVQSQSQTQQRKDKRRRMMAKINLLWKELRPDLRHSSTELRDARIDFAKAELQIASLGSFTELSDRQLEKILGALMKEQSSGVLPGCERHHLSPAQPSSGGAEVYHLASEAQVWAIEKVLAELRWTKDFCEQFIYDRFKRRTPKMLSPKSAHSLMNILLRMLAHREVKTQTGESVSKEQIDKHIPKVKQKLGIDQKPKR